MARFELHETFPYPKDSRLVMSADRLSDCIRAWEDDPDAGFGYVVVNTEEEFIVWEPNDVASFPAPHLIAVREEVEG